MLERGAFLEAVEEGPAATPSAKEVLYAPPPREVRLAIIFDLDKMNQFMTALLHVILWKAKAPTPQNVAMPSAPSFAGKPATGHVYTCSAKVCETYVVLRDRFA